METISELLRFSLTKHGTSTALRDKGTFTYAQVAQYAGYLAAALERQGVQQCEPVGIYLERSKEYIVAFVACLLYGYEAVLLDVGYAPERTKYMLQDAGVKVIIDADFWRQALIAKMSAPQTHVAPDTNALVVYTSGSTGKPKGVLHDQASVYEAVARFMRGLDYNEQDIYGSSAPYTFIAVGIDVLYPLCVGATVQVVPREVVKNAKTFAAYIDEHKITATNIPPKILKDFRKVGTSLRVATTGSERVSGIAPTDFPIFNLYGMSEGFPSVSIFEIDKAYATTPLGRGDGSLGIYLLNENGQEAEEGEICVSGHLFSRYLNLPEKTAQVLVPNPFVERDGHPLMFRTNDIGRRLPDGNLVYVNRKDWMLKINGFRVEPSSVEQVVKALPGIYDCVVKGFTDLQNKTYMVAYYVAQGAIEQGEIRRKLFTMLPYYMVPACFVRLEALPVNENGKLDYKALQEPEQDQPHVQPNATYAITTGANFAYLDYGAASVIKGQFTFTDPLDGKVLQEVAQEMLTALPFLAVKKQATADNTRYVLCPNRAAFPVLERETPCMPGEAAARDYLFTLGYHHRMLYLNVSHVLTDGFGINVMAHYLICRYLARKYDTHLMSTDLYNKQFRFDYADPLQFLRPVAEPADFKYSSESIFTQDLLDEARPWQYTLSLDAAQVRTLVHYAEGSISGLLAFLLGKALRSLTGEEKELVISSPADMRHVLGCEYTFRNCNSSIKYRFLPGVEQCSLKEILTIFKGMLVFQMNPLCCLPKFRRECSLLEALEQHTTITAKKQFLQSKLILSPHPIVTDAGHFHFGPWNDKVEDIHFFGNVLGGAGVVLGYILFKDRYILNITSTLKDETWLRNFCTLLKELGLAYELR